MAKLEDLKPGMKVKIVSNDIKKDSMAHFSDHTSMKRYVGLKGEVIEISEEIGNQLPIFVKLEVKFVYTDFFFDPENLEIITSEKET